jgi:hypothetical protein
LAHRFEFAELRQITLLLEQLDTVEEAKKSIHDLKLSKQYKVIELWRTVEERNASAADPPAMHATDDEELDSNALIIEVKDSAACIAEE